MAEAETPTEPEEVPPEGEEDPEAEAPQEEQPPVDDYAGPQEMDLIGDKRRVRIIATDPITGENRAVVGEAWQADDGMLHGTGVAAAMFFEPMEAARYKGASLAVDVSPLAAFYGRLARSPFFHAEFVELSNGSSQ